MATHITEQCIGCDACVAECPNQAITAGDPIYVIDPDLCPECVGFHSEEQCQAVCPVECCVPAPNRQGSETVLLERARRLHPLVIFGPAFPSRFRKG